VAGVLVIASTGCDSGDPHLDKFAIDDWCNSSRENYGPSGILHRGHRRLDGHVPDFHYLGHAGDHIRGMDVPEGRTVRGIGGKIGSGCAQEAVLLQLERLCDQGGYSQPATNSSSLLRMGWILLVRLHQV